MSEGFPYADLVVLALIAGFILLRLRGVLGQKIGHDSRDSEGAAQYGEYRKADTDTVVQVGERIQPRVPEKDVDAELLSAIKDLQVSAAIAAIKASDRSFTLKEFMDGARAAFEMVFDAFVKDDRETLRMLLAEENYAAFSSELDRRREADQHTETTLLAIVSQEVKAASLSGSMARITVRFVSEQVSVVRHRDGRIVGGDPAMSEHVEDEWTFERDVNSRNPNWKIVDT